MGTAFNALSVLLMVIVCSQFLHQAAAGTVGDACLTPDSLSGVCTPIRECPTLMATVAEFKKHRNETLSRYIKGCHCGPFKGRDPVACCAFTNATSDLADPNSVLPSAGAHPAIPNRLLGSDDEDVHDEEMDVDVANHTNVASVNNECGDWYSSKIFGGEEADMNEFPWMALLMFRNKRGTISYSCGGALINKRYVLTAAHCVVNTAKAGVLEGVRLGEHDTRNATDCNESFLGEVCASPPQDLSIETIIAHPRYDRTRLVNDIALIRLGADVDLTTAEVQPVCLPVGAALQFEDFGSTNLTVAGWGAIENRSLSHVLLKARIPGMALKTCVETYRPHNLTISRSHICAGGGQLRKDSCKGDSGGPLKKVVGARIFQVGVVSFGTIKCATPGFPGVYTRVGSFMKWILDTVQP